MMVTQEESKQVQEICFANNIGWKSGSNQVWLVYKQYLIIRDYISWEDKDRFYRNNLEEVDAKFFIRTNGSCVEENQEQELKQNIEEEQMKDNEVETYKDVKEYLVAKGLFDRVMEIKWYNPFSSGYGEKFSELFNWTNTKEHYYFWDSIDTKLMKLNLDYKIESLIQDYKAKQGKEFIQYLETQPKEVLEEAPKQPTNVKPKQYLVFVTSKGKPKRIHQSLESAQEEAKRLCKSGLCEVMVLEVVSKYQAKVIVEEV